MLFEGNVLRDRDYILDSQGNYLRVIGDVHNDKVCSFVKYHPNENGKRTINRKNYQYNNFIFNSLELVFDFPDRIEYSPQYGRIITSTPLQQIVKHYSCRKKVNEILDNREKYLNEKVGKYLIQFLEIVAEYIDINDLGITGSFLFDAENENSDIDLVCYGKDAYEGLYNFFKTNSFIQCYEEGLQDVIYKRRMEHLATASFESIILQESRKLQGIVRGSGVHINCQPLRTDVDIVSTEILDMGELTCIVEILDDCQGFYSPAIYRVKVKEIIDGSFYSEEHINEIKAMVSLDGTYAQCFRKDDVVFAYGKFAIMRIGEETLKIIELSSWNNREEYKAEILKAGHHK